MLIVNNLAGFGARRAAASSVFDPSSLYASGEKGAYYDFSDLTTMFQDRAGTTQVTADGQTVGKILDKSGNDNHIVAPSDAARPLYKTSGGLHWLQSDGVNNTMTATGVGMTQPTTTTIGFLVDSGKVTQGALMDGVSGRQLIEYNRGSRYTFELFAGVDEVSGGVTFANNTPSVVTCIFNSTSSRIRMNTVAGSVIDPGSNGFADLVISSFYNGSPFHEGRIYSMIVRGALSTTQEITDTETWVNGKTGAY